MAEIKGARLMCPPLGTYAPIADSMVIHPSLNELTAWAIEIMAGIKKVYLQNDIRL